MVEPKTNPEALPLKSRQSNWPQRYRRSCGEYSDNLCTLFNVGAQILCPVLWFGNYLPLEFSTSGFDHRVWCIFSPTGITHACDYKLPV